MNSFRDEAACCRLYMTRKGSAFGIRKPVARLKFPSHHTAMDANEFRRHAHELVDWMADFMENIRDYPVKAQVEPREIIEQIPEEPPQQAEPFEDIFADFNNIIVPGITHWQSPSFMAYFPANSSPPSVLAEMLTATLGAQCMSWATSPAATELEERMMQWLGRMIGLSQDWSGVIQDTASTATLCSLLTAREQATEYGINMHGFSGKERFTIYASTETHSSIEKDVKIAGFGAEALRKVPVDNNLAMHPEGLEKAIVRDIADGYRPLAVIATIGTTGTTAVDPLRDIAAISKQHDLWLHVDAAYAGTALVLEEYRHWLSGIDGADSFVFNPHKWMFTNFDCSAYFVKDEEALVRTFEILPEYLKTSEVTRVNNYRDWGIQLGRRFRALKLWFVIRTYGVDGIKATIRNHIVMARELADKIEAEDGFELMAPLTVNLICFRYHPTGMTNEVELDQLNEQLVSTVVATGRLYITHTRVHGKYAIRLVASNTNVTPDDLDNAWELIRTTARSL